MTIALKDLKPKSSKIKVKGKEYELKPFSLAIRVWAENYFAMPLRYFKNGLALSC